MEKPVRIKVKIPWYISLKGTIKDFFRILLGGQYCCNCKICFDYECEYCYIRKPHWYSKQIRTKFKPLDRNTKWYLRVVDAFKSLTSIKEEEEDGKN